MTSHLPQDQPDELRAERPRLNRILPNAGYYGWAVVATAMVCSALSAPGQSFALSLYIEHLIRDVGISHGDGGGGGPLPATLTHGDVGWRCAPSPSTRY